MGNREVSELGNLSADLLQDQLGLQRMLHWLSTYIAANCYLVLSSDKVLFLASMTIIYLHNKHK